MHRSQTTNLWTETQSMELDVQHVYTSYIVPKVSIGARCPVRCCGFQFLRRVADVRRRPYVAKSKMFQMK